MAAYEEKDILSRLNDLYQSGKIESALDERKFIDLYKEAVRDIYPKIKEEYADQSIYGISFEIANAVQRVYADDYYTIIYLNTEEMYEEALEDCEDEDEEAYYRFAAGAEWDVLDAKSPLFDEVQDYLEENSLAFCNRISAALERKMDEELKEWYEKAEGKIEDIHEKERENIRMWLARALGELRKEGFWESQENSDIYVIPFEGEGDIDPEEMISTFNEIDQGYHDSEYIDYIKENL